MAVRTATSPADLDRAAGSLARAFHDDPVFELLVPPGSRRREERMATLFRGMAGTAVRHGEVWVTDDGEAAALWLAPDRWKATPGVLLHEVVPAVRALRSRVVRGLVVQTKVEKEHPTEPHWYLHVLGTDPSHQGRGHGSTVLAPVLERCDRDLVPAYLESSKERNIPFYERHGFRVTGEIRPHRDVVVWPMWRDPAPSI